MNRAKSSKNRLMLLFKYIYVYHLGSVCTPLCAKNKVVTKRERQVDSSCNL